MRILLVDDHADSAKVMSKLLTRAGHVVKIASALTEAEHFCKPGRLDILICNTSLPDGAGWGMATLAKECGAKAIALIAEGSLDDIRRAVHHGFAAYMVKPVAIDALSQSLVGLATPRKWKRVGMRPGKRKTKCLDSNTSQKKKPSQPSLRLT
jgi:DNA-binding NtrC family response regulator